METNFITYLEQTFERDPPPRKGARTRELLKIVAARELAAAGYHDLRLKDITEAAGVAEGTIFSYFKDRAAVIDTVMQCFLEDFLRVHLSRDRPADSPPSPEGPFAQVRAGMRRWFAVCQENRGMMRCMMQMADDEPGFAVRVQQFNERWSRQISTEIQPDPAKIDRWPALIMTYVMKFMVNELVRKLFIYPDEIFLRKLEEVGGDHNLVADAASIVWMRVLHPASPLPTEDDARLGEMVEWIEGEDALAPPAAVPALARKSA